MLPPAHDTDPTGRIASRLAAYLPHDRRTAVARGIELPTDTTGSALFADISGFTPLTEQLVRQLGVRRGAEELARSINLVYEALIGEIERYDGSVIGFAGDSITCWFDAAAADAPARAVAAALAMQEAIRNFPTVGLKVAVASGPARRFVVGDPQTQLLDALAGATVARLAAADGLLGRGETLVDGATAAACLGLQVAGWRADDVGQRFAHIAGALGQPQPYATVPPDGIPLERVQCWVLPTVYDREQRQLGEFLTELRPASALFLRFDGIDYDGDSEAQHKLDALVREVQHVCRRLGGTLLQLTIGDKGSYLYVCFGAPTTHEDDDRRAVEAALALRALPHALPFLQPLQIGVSRGTLRVGAYGSASRRTYGALGDDVNLAARLMQAAAPGEVLVSQRIEATARAHFTFDPRPPLRVKGKSDPIPAFAVSHARGFARLHEPAARLPMVGRREEVAIISRALERAQQGHGQVLGIVAEAGLGKSRMVMAALHLARDYGFASFAGACESWGTNSAYLVWKPIWQAFFGINPALPSDQQLQALEARVAAYAPERQQSTPLLAELLDLPADDTPFIQALEPNDRRNALVALLEACVLREARLTPQLFVLEDLHWIDPLSHDLLEALARATAGATVCFLLAYRPAGLARLQAPRVEALPHFTRLALAEIGPADMAQLAHTKLAQLFPQRTASPPDDFIAQLSARAQGNPFFMEELLNYLSDRGIDPWQLDSAGAPLELPSSLHALVLSRIDQLTETQKATLKLASVIGRLFPFAWLHGYYPALGERSGILADLDVLARLDLTPLDTGEPELVYLFKHIVTQEVTYESMPYASRAQLHGRLAAFLEALDRARHLDLLAFHYGRSENTAKQREYFAAAGASAQAAYANESALDYYERLLPLLHEPTQLIDVQMRRGSVLELMGRWEAAELAYRAALDLADHRRDEASLARAAHSLGRLNSLRGDYPAARAMLEQAQSVWYTIGTPEEEARALIELGLVFVREGGYDQARRYLSDGLRLAQAASHEVLVAAALSALGLSALDQGDYAAGRSHFEEALALQHRIGSKQGIATALNDLGLAAQAQGDLRTARELQAKSLAVRREIGDRQGIAAALINLGDVAKEQGDLAEARAMFEEVLALQRDMSYRLGAASALCNLGQISWLQGDAVIARAHLDHSLAIMREIGHRSGVAWALGYAGEVVAGAGDYPGAITMLRESLDLGQQLGVKSYVARALCALGIVQSWQGEGAAGRAQLENGIALYRELGETPAVAWGLSNLGFVTLGLGDTPAALEALGQALALAQSVGAKPAILTSLAALVEVLAATPACAYQAAVLSGATEKLKHMIGAELTPVRRARYNHVLASLRTILSAHTFAAAFTKGQHMTLEEAIRVGSEHM